MYVSVWTGRFLASLTGPISRKQKTVKYERSQPLYQFVTTNAGVKKMSLFMLQRYTSTKPTQTYTPCIVALWVLSRGRVSNFSPHFLHVLVFSSSSHSTASLGFFLGLPANSKY